MRQEFEANREREKQLVYQQQQVQSSQGTQCSLSPTMSAYEPTAGHATTDTTAATTPSLTTPDFNRVKDDLKTTKRQLQEAQWRLQQKDMAIQVYSFSFIHALTTHSWVGM